MSKFDKSKLQMPTRPQNEPSVAKTAAVSVPSSVPDTPIFGVNPAPPLEVEGGAASGTEIASETGKLSDYLERIDKSHLLKDVPPAGSDGISHQPPLDDENKPFMPPIPDEGPSPNSIQAQHEGGYDFLEQRDPRRGTPKWLNGEELLQYISLAIVDMVEDWRPCKTNPKCIDVLQSMMTDLRRQWKFQQHFHPMRSQPIAFLNVIYDLMEHEERIAIVICVTLTTPEQKDLKPLTLTLNGLYESETWKTAEQFMKAKITGEAHDWSKTLSLDISKPNIARKRILSQQDTATSEMTLEQAVEKLRAAKVKGTRDWQIVQPIDGEPYVYSDRSSFSVSEAKLIAASLQ